MITHVTAPTRIAAAGNKPKVIEEFIGRVNTGTEGISIARMTSPEGWVEPGQTPGFDEYTLVLEGCLQITTRETTALVRAGEAVITAAGVWVQYSTPEPGGARYVAVCQPAFSPDTVHRDE